jgi:S-adenosylmethionine:tRNA ribosyltransferase-isomerase
MESEQIILPEAMANAVNKAQANSKRICAVGTEVMRAMETIVGTNGMIKPYDGWTNKFIFPPYNFSIADMMVTNFHHPKSSQYIMVSAFGDPDFVRQAYEIAIREKYKFSTYGDAMLIV